MLKTMAKFMSLQLLKLPLLSESGVSINLIPAPSEFSDSSDLDNFIMGLLLESTKLQLISSEE